MADNNLPAPTGGGVVPDVSKMSRRRLERISKAQIKRFEGMRVKEIAEFFGVGTRQIYKDLEAAREIARHEVVNFDTETVLGQLNTRLKFMVDRFTRLAEESTNEHNKVNFYRLAQNALQNYIKFLQDSGLLERKSEGGGLGGMVFTEEAFSIPEVRDLYLKIMIAVRRAEK